MTRMINFQNIHLTLLFFFSEPYDFFIENVQSKMDTASGTSEV